MGGTPVPFGPITSFSQVLKECSYKDVLDFQANHSLEDLSTKGGGGKKREQDMDRWTVKKIVPKEHALGPP